MRPLSWLPYVTFAVCIVMMLGQNTYGLTEPLTIEQALRLARKNNADLRIARAKLAVTHTGRIRARVSHPFNPSIALNPGIRIADNKKLSLDLEFGLDWEVEIGGQKRYRLRAAAHDFLANRAAVRYLEWAISRQVLMAFHHVLFARQRISVNLQVRALTSKLHQTVKRRFEAGADSILSVNLAQLKLAQVDKTHLDLRAKLEAARVRLTVLVGQSPQTRVRVKGRAKLPQKLTISLSELLKHALGARKDLLVQQRKILANRQRIKLADSKRIPNLIFSLKYAREEDANLIVGGIGLSLPFFQRNQGDRALFRALDLKLRLSEQKIKLEVQRSVVAAWLTYQAAHRRLTFYDKKIFGAFSKQLILLEKSYNAGKIGLLQVLQFQQELGHSQGEIVAAKAALVAARIRLEQVVGGSLSFNQKTRVN